MTAILPTTEQLANAAWAYGYIAATACALVLCWAATCCLLDRFKSRFFEAPKPPCRIYRFRTRVLSAASMGREAGSK